jgi:hypothetical protein
MRKKKSEQNGVVATTKLEELVEVQVALESQELD